MKRHLLSILILILLFSGCGPATEDTSDSHPQDDGDEADIPDGDFDTIIDGDSSSECFPGRWYCRDASSTWRCMDDGQGYDSYTYCPEGYLCYEGTCYLENQGDEDSPIIDGDDDYVDGDVTDGDVTDGDITDGDVTDGDVTDGDVTDGDVTDGDVTDGDVTDGDITDGDVTDGDVTDGDVSDGDVTDGDEDFDPEPEPDEDFEWDLESDRPYQDCENLVNNALWDCIKSHITNHNGLGYDNAKEIMFSVIDNYNHRVQCVYTGTWVDTVGIPNNNVMNTEHSWPQSYGADSGDAKGDLHHLFPSMSTVNSRRSNHPFGEVTSASWQDSGSKLGDDDWGRTVFEPRDVHKGDLVRALFYFAIRYDGRYDRVPWYEEDLMKQWNREDPPDAKEFDRNESIEEFQYKGNPFVLRPDFIDKIDDFTRGYRLINPPPPLPGE